MSNHLVVGTAAVLVDIAMRDCCRGADLVLSKFCPDGWLECDIFSVTDGRWTEYEIKMSRSDVSNDACKRLFELPDGTLRQRHRVAHFELHDTTYWRKHDLIASGDRRGPSKFWYVLPGWIMPADAVPAWAGLIEVYDSPRVTKQAPLLHDGRVSEHVMAQARETIAKRHRKKLREES